MSASKGGNAPHSASRSKLQPRLVHLISGLRRHQVEEAVDLLLDYIDYRAATNDGDLLAKVHSKLADYHLALDTSKHSGLSSNALASEIEGILAMPWQPGRELKRREAAS